MREHQVEGQIQTLRNLRKRKILKEGEENTHFTLVNNLRMQITTGFLTDTIQANGQREIFKSLNPPLSTPLFFCSN